MSTPSDIKCPVQGRDRLPFEHSYDMTSTTSAVRALLPRLCLFFALAWLLGVALGEYYEPDSKQLGLELIKAVVQVAAVIGGGHLIAAAVKDHEYARDLGDRERESERAAAERETQIAREAAARDNDIARERAERLAALRLEVLAKLSKAFVTVKGSRRILRAKALTSPSANTFNKGTHVRRDAYDEQMRAINAAELDIEALWHQLEATAGISVERATLVSCSKKMKDYLRSLLRQYERVLPQFAEATTLSSDAFRENDGDPTLLDFLSHEDSAIFHDAFVESYRTAATTLRERLLGESEAATA